MNSVSSIFKATQIGRLIKTKVSDRVIRAAIWKMPVKAKNWSVGSIELKKCFLILWVGSKLYLFKTPLAREFLQLFFKGWQIKLFLRQYLPHTNSYFSILVSWWQLQLKLRFKVSVHNTAFGLVSIRSVQTILVKCPIGLITLDDLGNVMSLINLS